MQKVDGREFHVATSSYGRRIDPDHEDQSFKSTFNFCCCHVRHWAISIGVAEIACFLADVLATAGFGFSSTIREDQVGLGVRIGVGILFAIISGVMIFGVVKKIPFLLIPHILMDILLIIASFSASVLAFLVANWSATPEVKRVVNEAQLENPFTAGMLKGMTNWLSGDQNYTPTGLTLLILVIVHSVFTYVMIKCFMYLRGQTKV